MTDQNLGNTQPVNYLSLFTKKNLLDAFNDKIIDSKGKGVDRKHVSTFKKNIGEEIDILYRKLFNGSFRFSPYLEILKVKDREQKPRLISIPTIRDRIVLELLKQYINGKFTESNIKKHPNHCINEIQNFISKNPGKKLFYLRTDIHDFYPSILHELLLNILKLSLKIKSMIDRIRSMTLQKTHYHKTPILRFQKPT
jgi:RNA-directed DNA polymerase